MSIDAKIDDERNVIPLRANRSENIHAQRKLIPQFHSPNNTPTCDKQRSTYSYLYCACWMIYIMTFAYDNCSRFILLTYV